MSSIPPTKRICEAINEFLTKGISDGENITNTLFLLGAQRLIQELLEQEATDYLGRERYERSGENSKGLRNGYKERHLKSAEGRIPVFLPQLRNTEETYSSKLWQFIKGNSDVLRYLVAEMYARGLSTRDIETTFTDEQGKCLISKSAVSEVTETLWEEYLAFSERDLSGFEVVYIFLDAVYEPMRLFKGPKEGILCAWAILVTGEKVLLHMDLGNKESYSSWLNFLRNMVGRGLKTPLSITSDGAPGLKKAIEEIWPQSLCIRCWVHKMNNVLDRIPDAHRAEVKAYLTAVRDAPDYESGFQRAKELVEKYEKEYPRAMSSFQDDLEASLAHLYLPAVHRKYVRTTNLIERSFGEQRRRSKVIPRFFDEKSALKLAFATLWRTSLKWRRVRFSEIEQKQVLELRKMLGLTHEQTSTDNKDQKKDGSAA
jgi:transposase-like protein